MIENFKFNLTLRWCLIRELRITRSFRLTRNVWLIWTRHEFWTSRSRRWTGVSRVWTGRWRALSASKFVITTREGLGNIFGWVSESYHPTGHGPTGKSRVLTSRPTGPLSILLKEVFSLLNNDWNIFIFMRLSSDSVRTIQSWYFKNRHDVKFWKFFRTLKIFGNLNFMFIWI